MKTNVTDYSTPAIFAGSAVGGAIAGNLAQSKIAFLKTKIGSLLVILVGIMIISRSKSDAMKGFGTGVAVSSATGLLKGLTGNPLGIDGLSGVGEVIQDENGMLYMVNGVGELEPYYADDLDGLDGEEYYEDLDGVEGEEYYEDLDGVDVTAYA